MVLRDLGSVVNIGNPRQGESVLFFLEREQQGLKKLLMVSFDKDAGAGVMEMLLAVGTE